MDSVLLKARTGIKYLIVLKLFIKVIDLGMNILVIRGINK
jgi:hypothetical protein